jgi:hypothetical protein
MPVQPCHEDGKPGYRWGESGKCYTYTPGDEESRERARALAERQGRAILAQEQAAMGQEIEHKGLRLEIKDAEQGFVEAIFSTFNVIDADGDVTLPEAFTDGARVRISAYGHGSWGGALPVGKGYIRVRGDQAILEGKFFLNTTQGREHWETIKQMGDLQEWSYGYEVVELGELTKQWQEAGARRVLKRLKVYEVSPVLVGAGIGTRTLALKSRRRIIPLSVIEQFCPACAKAMRERGWTGISLDVLLGRKQMPEQLLQGLCESLGDDPGIFTACMEKDFGDLDPGDKESFCAWLHHECTGMWPGEHRGEAGYRDATLKELARFEMTRARLLCKDNVI